MQQYYSDEQIRAMLLKEKKRKRRRKRVIKRCFVLFLLLVFIVLCVVSLVRCVSDKDTRSGFFTKQSLGLICIDPGHGGMDSGTNDNNRYEKDDNLKLALEVRSELEALGYEVKMTRAKDKDLKRSSRGKIANEAGADLFVSLHRNQSAVGEGDGVEVWIPSTNDDESRLLGENILAALEAQGFYARGVHAGTLHDATDDYLENSVPTMPSCLVEVGFTSDNGDNKLFDDNLKANAKAIAKAIADSHAKIYEKEE